MAVGKYDIILLRQRERERERETLCKKKGVKDKIFPAHAMKTYGGGIRGTVPLMLTSAVDGGE